nr:LuxR C-terminal-related transcriptional regulator [Allomuricauda sp.]
MDHLQHSRILKNFGRKRITMGLKSLILPLFLVSFLGLFAQSSSESLAVDIQKTNPSLHDKESFSEWEKFQRFEKQLSLDREEDSNETRLLRAYLRDSLQILEVKLEAAKMLKSKQLLDLDIQENTQYYVGLIKKLQASGIPQSEYRFLEEKIAYLEVASLEQKLNRSQKLNLFFIILSVVLALLFGWIFFRPIKTKTTELSKQERVVRNLILQGKTNKEIANELFISLSTVKTHITNLYAKLNVTSRGELLQKSTGTST